MPEINLNLKSYDELIMEISKLIGDKYLLQQENQQLKGQIKNIEEAYETEAEAKYYEYIDNHRSKLQQRIDKAIEYIENHSLYEEEYDYDYEENIYLSGINDETTKKDLLEILKGDNNE